MKQQHADYKMVPYPKIRQWMAAMFRSVQHKPMIHGLLEVDVTRARAHLKEHQATTGESLSFTAFLVACLAKAVDEHKAVQAFRKGSKRLTCISRLSMTWLARNKSCLPLSEQPIARPCARFITRSGQPRCRM